MDSYESTDDNSIVNANRQHHEEVNGIIREIPISIGEDKTPDRIEKSSRRKDEMKDIIKNASGACSLQSIEPSKRHDGTNSKNMVVLTPLQGSLSPARRESDDGSKAKGGEISAPSSYLSRDTLTLAQLYHSSRRSRHSPQNQNKKWHSSKVTPKVVPDLPFTFSSSFGSQQICQKIDNNDSVKKCQEEQWPFKIATPIYDSCSSISVSSVGSLEETEWLDEDDSVERNPKRRKEGCT
mmetsp:Transcript_9384/g.16326  ORF Transcript_9384/g.16326 Transcript_9384/m.16326 type:complete len:238 (+) Transcript_9384:260-973(+)